MNGAPVVVVTVCCGGAYRVLWWCLPCVGVYRVLSPIRRQIRTITSAPPAKYERVTGVSVTGNNDTRHVLALGAGGGAGGNAVGYIVGYGNFGIILDRGSLLSSAPPPHAPCVMLCRVPMLIGCRLVLAIRWYARFASSGTWTGCATTSTPRTMTTGRRCRAWSRSRTGSGSAYF